MDTILIADGIYTGPGNRDIIVEGLPVRALPGAVAAIEGFMPTAVNCVLIANLFGLNTRMASALFVVNTAIFLVLVLPILVFVFA